jgi:hypothetical protein
MQEQQHPQPGPGRRWRSTARAKRTTVIGALGVALAIAGIGVATAQSGSSSSSTSSSSTTSAAATATAPTPTPPGPPRPFDRFGKHGGPGGRFGGVGPLGALHGEFVVPNRGGGYRTIDTQTGQVSAVSPSSIGVKSDDGFAKTYAVDENTVVDAGRDGIANVKAGHTVHLVAVVEGSTAHAMDIEDTTNLGAIRQHWWPH